MSEMRNKAEVIYARMLAAVGLHGDAEMDILTKALEQARVQGRQEGFAEAREEAQQKVTDMFDQKTNPSTFGADLLHLVYEDVIDILRALRPKGSGSDG